MSNPPKFKVGDLAPDGNKIAEIVGLTDKVLVYRGEDESVGHFIDVDVMSDKDQQVIRKFEYLKGRLVDILPKREYKSFMQHLAAAQFQSFVADTPEKAIEAFAHIDARIAEFAKLFYLTAAFCTFLVLGAIAFLLYHSYPVEAHRIYALCLAFAFAGALASVMFRSGSIEVGPYEQRYTLGFRGIFRIALGGVLAAFFIAAAKGNLLLGITTSNAWSFLAFSFVSGFSERFGPALLSKLEETVKGDKRSDKSEKGAKTSDKQNGSGGGNASRIQTP